MKKFSKINESVSFDKSDIDRVSDILSDFKDESNFNIEITYMGTNGLTYGREIPKWMNTFNWVEIIINYKKDSSEVGFFEELNFFNQNIHNVISHLESMGEVFYKTNIEHERTIRTRSHTAKDRLGDKIISRVNLQSTIKVFAN
jgi:hypothetical protein